MFKDFKSQFLWCIICTFITGFICGISLTLVNTFLIILAFICLLFTILYWVTIFKRLDLQDRINSIYTDID